MESIKDKLHEIQHLFELVEARSQESSNQMRVRLVQQKMIMELDYFNDRLEELYYKYILKQKDLAKLETNIEKHIFTSQHTIHKFLPYVMLLDMMNDQSN